MTETTVFFAQADWTTQGPFVVMRLDQWIVNGQVFTDESVEVNHIGSLSKALRTVAHLTAAYNLVLLEDGSPPEAVEL